MNLDMQTTLKVTDWNLELAMFRESVLERQKRRRITGKPVAVPELTVPEASVDLRSFASFAAGPDEVQDEVTAQVQYVLNLRKGAFISLAFQSDGAGNTFRGFVLNAPYEHPDVQSVGYVIKLSPTGVVLAERLIRASSWNGVNHKADSMALMLVGAHILVGLTTHGLISEPRDNTVQYSLWTNIAVPYPAGQQAMGHAASFTGGVVVPEPGGGGITLEQLNQRFLDERVWLEGWYRTTIANMIPKTQIAIQGLNMWSPSMQARGADQWVRDRVWQVFSENNWISHFSGAAIGESSLANAASAFRATAKTERQLAIAEPSPVDGLPTDWDFVFGVDDRPKPDGYR